MHILLYINMPNVTAGYGRFSDIMCFLGILMYYYIFENDIYLDNFIKLLEVVF